ncbi:ankyrin repeat-containing domain protein [Penicillium coprophilum]|uniref:ankyrin repeat-containing domain protein n=1 Tax=Penicillium coprophilum TaxID=36646 RepID=UPI00239F32C9|nr:ankyrin repeat-containing domain protein [Penicillium coprophilum]KAJ5171593.1 ankyrin repeat-containing domain protein [Penicillium coprophilum]
MPATTASRKVGLVQLVIDAGANIDARVTFGLRGLPKANPNTEDKKLGRPAQAAASLGNVDMMLMLLDHGARADGFWWPLGNTLQAAFFNDSVFDS